MKKILCFILFIILSLFYVSIADEECQHKNIGPIYEYWTFDYYDKEIKMHINTKIIEEFDCFDCCSYIQREKENPYVTAHKDHEIKDLIYSYMDGYGLIANGICYTCECIICYKIDHTCEMTDWILSTYNYEEKINIYKRTCKDEICDHIEYLKVYGDPIIENLPDEKDEDITPIQIHSINNNPVTIGSYTINNVCYMAPWSKYQKHDHEWTSMKYWGKDNYGNETYEFICECGAVCFAHDGDFVDNNKEVKTITITIKGIEMEFTPEEYEELKAQIN